MPLPRTHTVLIANDQEWTARSLESILAQEGHEVVRAYTGQQAIDQAVRVRPALVVLDFQLPDYSGPEVCRVLRDHPGIGWGTPIVLTTAGSSGRARQAEAFQAGAWDFWPQPFDAELVLHKVRSYLRAHVELLAAREGALLDAATGLLTPTGVVERLP